MSTLPPAPADRAPVPEPAPEPVFIIEHRRLARPRPLTPEEAEVAFAPREIEIG